MVDVGLDVFDPRVKEWFLSRFGAPTDIQARAWPVIAAGGHVLLTAPTGSGKTLTAFLWALDRLATGAWERGTVRALYVSPLKALGNDIRRNLVEPLEGLRAAFGDAMPDFSVQVRSGDTPADERRRMLKRPPEILVTTPESLNLLLSSHGGRAMLKGVETVLLDEIHAVAGNKRGSYLMTAVERLTELSGEFQRVALSATVRPLDLVASFVGGPGRAVRTVRSDAEKRLELTVRSVEGSGWPALVSEFKGLLDRNRSTLFFVNNRALSEKLARWTNDAADAPVAYAHHGSLSREIRELVEAKLKEGSLKALVATSSLEMGIDIGSLDEVVLVQSPRSVHSAVQRVGRAGHAVGATSRGRLYPTHGRDYLEAAVLAPLVEARDVEAVRPVRNPLDVLAQVLLAMLGVEERDLDGVHALLRRSWPYKDLSREVFERVVSMLRGRYADVRIRELKPRLRVEGGRAKGRDGVLPLVWRSGGVIPDRGYFTIRVAGSRARVGELDEEFVWERRVGDTFSIGAQTWRIERVTKSDVLVAAAGGARATAPFWRAETWPREFEYCERIGRFLEEADGALDDPAFRDRLLERHRLDEGAADALLGFLQRQKEATGAPLPHRTHLLVEHFAEGDAKQVIFHATWGGRVLRPLGMALAAAWEERYGTAPDVFTDDDCVLLHLPHDAPDPVLLALVTPESVERLVRKRLDRTGFFGARFRESAMRALLLPRSRGQRRMPLWLNRLRAKKLLEAVRGKRDFPIVAETWRACLEDEFDLGGLAALLEEVRSGRIRTRDVKTSAPSPFAGGVAWRSTSEYMYGDDVPVSGGPSLSEEVLQEVLFDSALRPKLDPGLVAAFEAKLQRTAPGYEPTEDADWLDLVEERLLVPPWTGDLPPGLERAGWGPRWIVSTEQRPRLEQARRGDMTECIGQFLQTHGPVTEAYLRESWDLPVADALARLVEEGRVIAGCLRPGAAETEFCDVENLERLLRMTRAAARPSVEARPLERLPLFLATVQGIVRKGDLRVALETLFGHPAPARLWEQAILPARVDGYDPAELDALLRESDLCWIGARKERLLFCFREDVRLFARAEKESALLPGAYGRYDFLHLQKQTGLVPAELTKRLWEEAWEGLVTNDGFDAVRKGVLSRFRAAEPTARRRAWQASRPMPGNWEAVPRDDAADALEGAEDDRERARRLLARYGVLFRELCLQEPPLLRWGRLLRALRLMELSGEVVAGHFFDGVDGLQFATHEAVRLLAAQPDDDAAWWINATDPASLCGLGLLDGLPPRLPTTWLAYRGSRLAMVVHRNGKRVELTGEPVFGVFDRLSRVFIEEIDGVPAARSPHAERFLEHGFERDMERLVRYRTPGG